MIKRADGSEVRFRVFEEYHAKLASEGGRHGAGGHRDSRQVKLAVGDVF